VASKGQGRGFIENEHSTDVEPHPLPPHHCMSIQPQGESCLDIGRVLVSMTLLHGEAG